MAIGTSLKTLKNVEDFQLYIALNGIKNNGALEIGNGISCMQKLEKLRIKIDDFNSI